MCVRMYALGTYDCTVVWMYRCLYVCRSTCIYIYMDYVYKPENFVLQETLDSRSRARASFPSYL